MTAAGLTIAAFTIALAFFVGISALMFQLHAATKKELNEDDSLEQNLRSAISRHRNAAFGSVSAVSSIQAEIESLTMAGTADEETLESAEADLFERIVKVYGPLQTCVKARNIRKKHIAFLSMGKGFSFAALAFGLACVISDVIVFLFATGGVFLFLKVAAPIFVALVVTSVVFWYRADSCHTRLAQMRRSIGG